jgi:DNA invertase Pin-like site-specific DNA recombinase
MFHMCGVFAEFERGMIRERVNAGLARAKGSIKLNTTRIATDGPVRIDSFVLSMP